MNDQKVINFFEKLYFETETNNCKLANNNLLFPKINGKENMKCESPITESECLKAVSELSNNKSSVRNGLSVEFCKSFWQDLKELFLKCLKYSLLVNQLYDSQYEGLITTIPKCGKNAMYISNYRPINLLNCDCKTIFKMINNRI